MKKKSLLLLVSVVMSLSMILAACGGNKSGESGKANKDQVLRINNTTEPFSMHPGIANDSTSSSILNQTFEGLTRIGKSGKPEMAMAKDVKKSDDGLTYTFTLRDGLKWSNGDALTAKDFEYAWKWVLNPKNESQYSYQLYYIKNGEKAFNGQVPADQIGVKAIDDKTLEVQLEHPTPYFLQLTAFYTYFPVNSKVAEKNPKWASDAGENYTSNGPFKMVEWKHNDKIVLEKNENYWDKKNVKLNKIQVAMINDSNTELNKFKSGELDWAGNPTGNLPVEAIPSLKKDKSLKIEPKAGVYWIKINTEVKPFNNKKVRQALAYAIDRQEIVDKVLQGGQMPAMANVPPTMFKENEKGYFKDNNVKEAKRLLDEGLKEEGYTGVNDPKLPPIEYSYNTLQEHQKIAQAVQDMWKKNLGLKVELKNEEWKVYIDKLHSGDYQVGRMGWIADFNDPINFLEIFRDKKGGNNDTNWENAQYKQLLDDSATVTDPAKRADMLKQAEKILVDEMPVIPLYFYTNVYVQNDHLKDVVITPLGEAQFKWASFKN